MTIESSTAPRPEFRDLDTFCQTEIAPWLRDHDGRRRRARRLRWLIIGTGLAALGAGCYYLLREPAGTHGVWFLGILFGAGAIIKVGNLAGRSLEADVRDFAMNKFARFFDFTYQAHASLDDIESFRDLLPSYTSVDFGGGLRGVVKGVPFQMVEIKLRESRSTGRSSGTMRVFRELALGMPCDADGAVTVRRREDIPWRDGEEQRALTLCDSEFHENYVVRESEVGAAARILGPEARRLFTKLDSLDAIRDIRLGIRSGRLLLVIERSIDSFEDGHLDSPLADPDRIQGMADLFAIPFDAVDAFKPQPAAPETGAGGAAIQGSA